MEKQFCYSIYDEKAKEFSPPFFTINDNLAKRIVMESMRGKSMMLSSYPDDFKLYCIGEFNKTTGKIEGYDMPVLVVSVVELDNIMKRRENHGENS